MVPVLVVVTLAAVVYSLWMRRETWWSRWEIGVTVAIALYGVAVILLSPWGSATLGPPLHRAVGLGNAGHLLAWFCVIVAMVSNVYHVLVRLVDPGQARQLMRRQLGVPVCVGVALMAVTFVRADEDPLAHGFAAHGSSGWFTAFWVVTGSLVIFLNGYGTRALLPLKVDSRARETYRLYQASMAFGVVAVVLQAVSVGFDLDASVAVWAAAAASVSVFAIGSARSWQAKAAWFIANGSASGSRGDAG